MHSVVDKAVEDLEIRCRPQGLPDGPRLDGVRVVRELERLVMERGLQEVIVSDNGCELTAPRCYAGRSARLDWHYIAPGSVYAMAVRS